MQWIYNDGGRAKYFKAEHAGDCVCRSFAIASGLDYLEIYNMINEIAKTERTGKRKKGKSEARNGVYKTTIDKLGKRLGFVWVPIMKIGSGCKVHVSSKELPRQGTYILSLSRHYSCLVNGVINDTFDPSRGGTRCVYGYWYKPEKF